MESRHFHWKKFGFRDFEQTQITTVVHATTQKSFYTWRWTRVME
jgi:hypothetical protein